MSHIYILGAGASAGYENTTSDMCPPVASTFFQTVARLLESNNEMNGRRFPDLWEFLRRYYRVNVENLANCDLDIEEVLTLIDVSGAKPNKARRQLLDLIALTLEKVICRGPCRHHRRLVDGLGPDDAVITFNWDLLLDNVVASSNPGGPNYGTNLLEPLSTLNLPQSAEVPKILKLHGSMNWMTCPRCRKSFAHILQGKPAASYHAGQDVNCRYCNGPTEPLMIPPTLLKNYRHPVIKAVWDEAGRALQQADEITIIGYSLPLTDFKAKWLFMRTSAARKTQLRRLTIIDKEPEPVVRRRLQSAFHTDDGLVQAIEGSIKDLPEQ